MNRGQQFVARGVGVVVLILLALLLQARRDSADHRQRVAEALEADRREAEFPAAPMSRDEELRACAEGSAEDVSEVRALMQSVVDDRASSEVVAEERVEAMRRCLELRRGWEPSDAAAAATDWFENAPLPSDTAPRAGTETGR